MNKILIAGAGLVGIGVLFAVIILIAGISFHNNEVTQKNGIVAKQTDNKNQMDTMWKIIGQVAEVSTAQKDALIEIFNGYASARGSGGGTLMKWVQEVVPNAEPTSKTYITLMNTITAQREDFKRRQTELLDLNREHDNLITRFPGVVFATILGRKHIDVVIVTSTRTEDAFKMGKDDAVQLFKK